MILTVRGTGTISSVMSMNGSGGAGTASSDGSHSRTSGSSRDAGTAVNGAPIKPDIGSNAGSAVGSDFALEQGREPS